MAPPAAAPAASAPQAAEASAPRAAGCVAGRGVEALAPAGPTPGAAEAMAPPAAAPAASAPQAAEAMAVVRTLLLGIGRIMGWSAAGYTFLVVLPSYLQVTLHASFRQALIATVLANLGFAAAILPAGVLSDRIGRRAVMLCGAGLVVLLALPLLHLLRNPAAGTPAKAAALLAAGAVIGLLAGPGPAMLAEMFPTAVRCTGLATAYALSNAVFAGCAGLLVTELVRRTGNPDVPALYAAGACALGIPALLTLRPDDHRRPLP
ncbi:hypothetical protein DEJ50_04230 [Streptomyces venezuelae]|uniref:Major facilitator superfamily (MFS) profile domain-containing protein n=2 Tax=Streptomyces venezuelae TaxID=54571 RepID=A0A5P2DGN2_STRVZ|nr:hypothetical protein DEJ50_04230 [Streptomyces venezuelae]